MQSVMKGRIYYVSPSMIIKRVEGRGPFLILRNGVPSAEEIEKAVALCNMRIIGKEGGEDTYLLEELEDMVWRKDQPQSESQEQASS